MIVCVEMGCLSDEDEERRSDKRANFHLGRDGQKDWPQETAVEGRYRGWKKGKRYEKSGRLE